MKKQYRTAGGIIVVILLVVVIVVLASNHSEKRASKSKSDKQEMVVSGNEKDILEKVPEDEQQDVTQDVSGDTTIKKNPETATVTEIQVPETDGETEIVEETKPITGNDIKDTEEDKTDNSKSDNSTPIELPFVPYS